MCRSEWKQFEIKRIRTDWGAVDTLGGIGAVSGDASLGDDLWSLCGLAFSLGNTSCLTDFGLDDWQRTNKQPVAKTNQSV